MQATEGYYIERGWAETPSFRSFLPPLSRPSAVGCSIVDPRLVGTEEFVFSQIPVIQSKPCSVHPCGGKPSRRSCPRSFLLNGEDSTAAHFRSELALSVRATVLRRHVLRGLSLDNAGVIPRCHGLRHPRLQRPYLLLTSPRVLIHDSSPRTSILPKGQTNCRCCRLLGSEGG